MVVKILTLAITIAGLFFIVRFTIKKLKQVDDEMLQEKIKNKKKEVKKIDEAYNGVKNINTKNLAKKKKRVYKILD